MKYKGISDNYQDAYEKHEEHKRKMKESAEKYQFEGLLKLASAYGITSEDLLRILAGDQGIDPELGKRIDYQWAIDFGTIKAKAPKPFLNLDIRVPEPPEIKIKMCTTFTRLSGLEDKNTLYEAPNYRDVLPTFVTYENYDNAMDPICAYLDDWAVKFFRKKDKSMRLVKVPKMSMSTHYAGDCPDARRFEYDFFDVETGKPRYSFIYTKGKIVKSQGALPISEIVFLLKKIGVWER